MERLKKMPGILLAWLSCSFLQTFLSLSVICVLHACFSIKSTDFGVGVFCQFCTEVIHIILMLLLFFLFRMGPKRRILIIVYSSFSFYSLFFTTYDFVVIELCDCILLCVLPVEEQVQMEREKINGSGTTTKLTRKMSHTFLCW